jgi:hypothetical protein
MQSVYLEFFPLSDVTRQECGFSFFLIPFVHLQYNIWTHACIDAHAMLFLFWISRI